MIGVGPGGFVRYLLSMLAGPLIWFIYFSVIYGAVGFGGAFGFAPSGIRLFAWAATLAAGAALILLLWYARRSRASIEPKGPRAVHEVAGFLTALSLFAVLIEALALLIVPL